MFSKCSSSSKETIIFHSFIPSTNTQLSTSCVSSLRKHSPGTGLSNEQSRQKCPLSRTSVLGLENTLQHPKAQMFNKYSQMLLLKRRNDGQGGEAWG